MKTSIKYVGMDVQRETIAVSVAPSKGGRGLEVLLGGRPPRLRHPSPIDGVGVAVPVERLPPQCLNFRCRRMQALAHAARNLLNHGKGNGVMALVQFEESTARQHIYFSVMKRQRLGGVAAGVQETDSTQNYRLESRWPSETRPFCAVAGLP